MKSSITIIIALLITSQLTAQCPALKQGQQYAFFRVTNFNKKICWLSEPFAYKIINDKIAGYEGMKECFIQKVKALGGSIEHDIDAFGIDKIKWLDNTFDPNAELSSSYNWNLPSREACFKSMSGEIAYKTNVGITVKIVRIFSSGLMDNAELH